MPLRLQAPVVLASLLLLAACRENRTTGPIEALPFATAAQSCGPADGPAVEIILAPSADTAALPQVRVLIYESITRLERRWTLGAGEGFATYVSAPGEFEGLASGSVQIERVDPSNAVTGTVSLVFARAGTIRGRFHATWVPRTMLCG